MRGSAGAVPGGADVVVATLDTGHYATARAAADGSFSASVFAPRGASVTGSGGKRQHFARQLVIQGEEIQMPVQAAGHPRRRGVRK